MVSARGAAYNRSGNRPIREGLRDILILYSQEHALLRIGEIMARIEVKSEITGTVWQIKSKPGDKVEEGDTLVVIESMKMEIPVITEDGGVVKEILVKEKDPVAEGQVVAILEG
jgi:acetyl-CoA carboxylase biotin carboxyl carrier protein